jgi:putative membrane protein
MNNTVPRVTTTWDLVIAIALALGLVVYALGLRRLWRRAGARHGLRAWQVAAYGAGVLSLWIALLSPLESLSAVLFSAHMGQHELLMLVSAPLIVMGRPLYALGWALPARARRAAGVFLERPAVRAAWRRLTNPWTVLLLHGAALWIWHVPGLFEHALAHDSVHALQHLSFFLTAALFWWAMLDGRYGRVGYGVAVLFVFATALHSGLLGAMITFAQGLWYPTHEARTRAAGLDPLEDQQLAGLIMWIPAGVLLTLLALALLSAWLGEAERRARRLDGGGGAS